MADPTEEYEWECTLAQIGLIAIFVPQLSHMKLKSFIVIIAFCAFLHDWVAFDCGGGIFL